MEELEITSDTDRRTEIAQELQAAIYEDNMHIYLMHVNQYTVTSNQLGNYNATGFGGFRSYDLWKVTKSK